ncbi:Uncharacterized protein TCM_006266 [Theobroma cacao]|uniref:RNase H type-1 domain-containing protein n=1 Tax=Theobroma cacao TaxID=3641 RepID=A0A061DX02_THECC|nr:Uncharacterized protein TCM_006266 [Theobroma cacao]
MDNRRWLESLFSVYVKNLSKRLTWTAIKGAFEEYETGDGEGTAMGEPSVDRWEEDSCEESSTLKGPKQQRENNVGGEMNRMKKGDNSRVVSAQDNVTPDQKPVNAHNSQRQQAQLRQKVSCETIQSKLLEEGISTQVRVLEGLLLISNRVTIEVGGKMHTIYVSIASGEGVDDRVVYSNAQQSKKQTEAMNNIGKRDGGADSKKMSVEFKLKENLGCDRSSRLESLSFPQPNGKNGVQRRQEQGKNLKKDREDRNMEAEKVGEEKVTNEIAIEQKSENIVGRGQRRKSCLVFKSRSGATKEGNGRGEGRDGTKKGKKGKSQKNQEEEEHVTGNDENKLGINKLNKMIGDGIRERMASGEEVKDFTANGNEWLASNPRRSSRERCSCRKYSLEQENSLRSSRKWKGRVKKTQLATKARSNSSKSSKTKDRMSGIREMLEEEEGIRDMDEQCMVKFVQSIGASGGLLSIWEADFFDLEFCFESRHFILLVGGIKSLNLKCGLGNIYALNPGSERRDLWNELQGLMNSVGVPCEMDQFKNFVEEMGLMDLPMQGGRFTYRNFREEEAFSRLDRFLVSGELVDKVGQIIQKRLPASLSDHNPILLGEVAMDWGPKPFKFFNHWLEEKSFSSMFLKKEKVAKVRELYGKFKVLNEAKAKELERALIEKEVWEAIESCDENKASRPDGLIEGCVNVTFITLVSKCSSPESIRDYKPISLMKNGLRQGCPLSPFIFNCVAEAFSVLMSNAVRLQLCKGIEVGERGLVISHLQFTDDTVIMCRSEWELGWVNLQLKNKALLNKWIWRSGNEKDNLWKRVLVEKEGDDHDEQHRTLREGIGFILGKGKNVRFWTEEWIKRRIVKEDFSRIFAVATNKEGRVKEFGVWVDGSWQWRIELRRMLFGWENEQTMVYKERTPDDIWKKVWYGAAPLKVEIFYGRVIKGRVAVKAKLMKRGLLRKDLALYKGFLKFNVDGVVRGTSGQAVVGGVLMDEGGAIKVMFSKSIGTADAHTTEILAIRKAFKIFGVSKWVMSHSLMVESDSSNAVSWFHNPKKAPWNLRRELLILEGIKRRIGEFKVIKISKESNNMVDELAKSGVMREEEILGRRKVRVEFIVGVSMGRDRMLHFKEAVRGNCYQE